MEKIEARLSQLDERVSSLAEEPNAHSGQLARIDQRIIDLKDSLDVERRLARLDASAGLNNG